MVKAVYVNGIEAERFLASQLTSQLAGRTVVNHTDEVQSLIVGCRFRRNMYLAAMIAATVIGVLVTTGLLILTLGKAMDFALSAGFCVSAFCGRKFKIYAQCLTLLQKPAYHEFAKLNGFRITTNNVTDVTQLWNLRQKIEAEPTETQKDYNQRLLRLKTT
jgi:hypothetical protein